MPAPKGNQYAVGNHGGAPTKYIPEYAEQARKLCKLGATDADLADFFHVAVSTIWSWTTRYDEFQRATRIAKAEADELVERSLYHQARGYTIDRIKPMVVEKAIVDHEVTEYIQPNVTACIFWLKNRRPQEWRDRTEVNGKVDVSGTVQHQHSHQLLQPEALAALSFDEVQRLAAEEIALAPGVSLLPPPAPAGDETVRDET